MVRELRLKLGQLELDLVEALAIRSLERHAGQCGVTHGCRDDAPLGRVEPLPLRAVAQGACGVKERTALSVAGRETNHVGLHSLEGPAQRVAVLYAHQVARHAPAEVERIGETLERLHQVRPGRSRGCLERVELSTEALEQLSDAGLDVLGRDRVEAGQTRGVE